MGKGSKSKGRCSIGRGRGSKGARDSKNVGRGSKSKCRCSKDKGKSRKGGIAKANKTVSLKYGWSRTLLYLSLKRHAFNRTIFLFSYK